MVYKSSSGTFYTKINYVGIFLSMLWIVSAIYLYNSIYKLNIIDNKNKNYYYIIPTLLILLVVITNGIYIYNVNNDKYKNFTKENVEFIKKAKSRYVNILLVPIFIIIIFSLVMIFNKKMFVIN
jgi:Na+/H+ antiporter NhaC